LVTGQDFCGWISSELALVEPMPALFLAPGIDRSLPIIFI